VSGAAVLVNVGGAGTVDAPFTLTNTTYTGHCTADVTLLCHKSYCAELNIAANSTVDRRGETVPVATHDAIENCP
jgi:hypothetical protein